MKNKILNQLFLYSLSFMSNLVGPSGFAADASVVCPSLQARSYACSNSVNGQTATVTVSMTQDAQGNSAITFAFQNADTSNSNTLSCLSANQQSQTICTPDQRASSPDVASQCDSTFGTGAQGTVSVNASSSDTRMRQDVGIASSGGTSGDVNDTASIEVDKLDDTSFHMSVSASQNGSQQLSVDINCN